MHLAVVTEREISALVMCVGVFRITMTRPGAGLNGCVSSLQVQVKRVNNIRVVNSRFTHGVAVFVWGTLCCRCACGDSRSVVCIHLPAVCPHCVMGQIVLRNKRRAVLTEAVRFVAMVL